MSNNEFDYIIVGAGSAGSLLARRLSESGQFTVCVLEAGPPDRHPFLHMPAGFIKALSNPDLTWQFKTEPTERTAGRAIPTVQGRTLGGSSSINGLVYNRGQPMDYDVWAQRGNRGWSYSEVLPYFMRCEGREGNSDPAVRGRNGALTVSDIDWRDPLCDAFVEGVRGLGIPYNSDHNDGEQAGVGYYQRTIERTRRRSSARAFLHPALRDGQVDVRVGVQAHRVLFKGRRAIGIEYTLPSADRRLVQIHARREVIICAGTINSAKLLQLSGVGAPDLLAERGIEVHHALPGVGENLQDHYAVRMVASVRNAQTINERARFPHVAFEAMKWLLRKPSVLGLSPSLAHVFWMSESTLEYPDLQFTFTPASYRKGQPGLLDNFPGMTVGIWQHRPQSVGYVRIRSDEPAEHPEIQPNYLESEADRRALVGGIRLARSFMGTPALQRYNAGETSPGTQAETDDELLQWAYEEGSTAYHLVGTCRMGPTSDPTAVVDHELKVHGLEGLRVVDASVMPAVTSGNTNAPTMMIAEKAADMILGRPPLASAFSGEDSDLGEEA
jgi:choline dehydrogenase